VRLQASLNASVLATSAMASDACCCLQDNQTALMTASYEGHKKVVILLTQEGAKVNRTDKVGESTYIYTWI